VAFRPPIARGLAFSGFAIVPEGLSALKKNTLGYFMLVSYFLSKI
jgi:hypothetical protein